MQRESMRVGLVMLSFLFVTSSGLAQNATPSGSLAAPVARFPKVSIVVPAYFYPSGDGLGYWQKLRESASDDTPIIAIVNPDSGPGKAVEANYRKLIDQNAGSKLQLVGYVTFSYGKRPLSAIKADIDSWLYFYPEIKGIFFDEQPSQADWAAPALDCFAYARSKIKDAVLIANPGVPCAREYLAGADSAISCWYEHHAIYERYRPTEWAKALPAEKFLLFALWGKIK